MTNVHMAHFQSEMLASYSLFWKIVVLDCEKQRHKVDEISTKGKNKQGLKNVGIWCYFFHAGACCLLLANHKTASVPNTFVHNSLRKLDNLKTPKVPTHSFVICCC
jgi:hypothetical protein